MGLRYVRVNATLCPSMTIVSCFPSKKASTGSIVPDASVNSLPFASTDQCPSRRSAPTAGVIVAIPFFLNVTVTIGLVQVPVQVVGSQTRG